MYSRYVFLNLLVLALAALVPAQATAQPVFDTLQKVGDWVDYEDQSNEMPAQVWADCDVTQADRVGIRVEFDDGLSGYAVYSGVSQLWNSTFPGIDEDTDGGILDACTGMHFLYNNGVNLPMAWESCDTPYASNFDLDYQEQNGSHFRATTTGWVSAHFETFCGDIAVPNPVPTFTSPGLVIMWVLLALAGIIGLKARKRFV